MERHELRDAASAADLLGSDETIEVVAQAADGLLAVEQATAHHVDVALVDIRMPHMDGITADPAALGRRRFAVADHAAYEAFVMGRLSSLPAVLRLESHLTMKTIKLDG